MQHSPHEGAGIQRCSSTFCPSMCRTISSSDISASYQEKRIGQHFLRIPNCDHCIHSKGFFLPISSLLCFIIKVRSSSFSIAWHRIRIYSTAIAPRAIKDRLGFIFSLPLSSVSKPADNEISHAPLGAHIPPFFSIYIVVKPERCSENLQTDICIRDDETASCNFRVGVEQFVKSSID